MSISLFIVDAVLLLIFIVGWIEASGNYSYRLTFWRFLRAASLPFLIGVVIHLVVMSDWGQNLPNILRYTFNSTHWLTLALLAVIRFIAVIVFMAGLPFAVLGLTLFVIRQFAPDAAGDVAKSLP